MLIKFLAHTGAVKGDHDARAALTYLLGETVMKPDLTGAGRVPTRRATAPVLISGDPELLSAICADLPFQHRYTSGVIAFDKSDIDIARYSAADPVLRAITDTLMHDFEETAFAGIPVQARPQVVWVAHTDKGRLELNFLFPRVAINALGKIRAINPKPPGKMANDLWSAFRDTWNARHGWADPLARERHRPLKLPDGVLADGVLADPPRDADDVPDFDIREKIAFAIDDAIQDGKIESRHDIVDWFEAQGYRISREGKDYISVRFEGPRPEGGPRNACPHPPKGKAIRLRGDLFDARFTSLDWLETCGYNDGGLDPARRDMRGAPVDLACLRATRAAHHRKRLGWPEDNAPAADADNAADEQSVDVEGLTCSWPPEPRADARNSASELNSVRRPGRPASFAEARIPDDLLAKLRYVDNRRETIWLHDSSSLNEQDNRLRAFNRTRDTIRLMIARARTKGWSGISARGDEAFLRDAARLAYAAGIKIAGRDAAMDEVVRDELAKLRAKAEMKEGAFVPRATAEAGSAAQVSDAPTSTVDESADINSEPAQSEDLPDSNDDAFEPDML